MPRARFISYAVGTAIAIPVLMIAVSAFCSASLIDKESPANEAINVNVANALKNKNSEKLRSGLEDALAGLSDVDVASALEAEDFQKEIFENKIFFFLDSKSSCFFLHPSRRLSVWLENGKSDVTVVYMGI